MVGPNLRAPGAIALFEPQGFDGAIAGIGDAVRGACRHEGVIDGCRELDRHMQLPAEFADVGDAQRQRLGLRQSSGGARAQTGMPRSRHRPALGPASTSRDRGPISTSTA